MLDSHPRMKVYTELFLDYAEGRPIWGPNDVEFHRTFLEDKLGSSLTLPRAYWTVRYLKHIYGATDASVVGFKYMYDQIPHSIAVLPYAARARVRVVHLVRWNLLDTVISAKLAERTGLYHLAADHRQTVPWWPTERGEETIRLDVAEALRELRRLSRQRQWMRGWLRRTGTLHHELQYERAARDPEAFCETLEFLGLSMPSEGLHSGLEKVRVRSQSEVVENLTEIRGALSGTPYEAFLHAG